jgi:hypothetical protein
MMVEISRAIVREYLRLDQELTVVLQYDGPEALPICYRWPGPMRPVWASLECPELDVRVEREGKFETPKRPYGRLGRAHEGYAALILGGSELVRAYYRSGRCDPTTQRAAMQALHYVLLGLWGETELGKLAAPVKAA